MKIGDFFEVETSIGFGYLQFRFKAPRFPALIRVLAGLHTSRPSDMAKVAASRTLQWTHIALGAALYHRLVAYVGNYPFPPREKELPTMRASGIPDRDGVAHIWRILRLKEDGSKDLVRVVQRLAAAEARLSSYRIVSYPVLVDIMEAQQTPQQEPFARRAMT